MRQFERGWHIGEIRLRLPHMSTADARWIANQVALRLANLPAPEGTIQTVHVRVPWQPQRGREGLTSGIVRSVAESFR